MKQSERAFLTLIATALLWSTGGFFIKWVSWPALAVGGTRSLVAALCLLWVFGRRRFSFSKYAWGGAIAYAATVTLFVLANKWTTAANAVVLQFSAPIYVAIFAPWFLNERNTWLDVLALIVAIFGMGLFFLDQISLQNIYGNIAGVLSGLSFAWLVMCLRKQRGANLESVVLGNFLAAAACLPFASGFDFELRNIVGVLFLGLFQLALPYYLYGKAIQHVQALKAMIVMFLEPILNPLWVFLLMGERPGPNAMLGGLLIVSAVLSRQFLPKLLKIKKI